MIFFVVLLYLLLQYQLNVWVLTTLNLVLDSKRAKSILVLREVFVFDDYVFEYFLMNMLF